MINKKKLKKDGAKVVNQLKKKGFDLDLEYFLKQDGRQAFFQNAIQKLQAEKNKISKEIGFLKSQNKNFENLIARVEVINNEMCEISKDVEVITNDIGSFLLNIPNIPHFSVCHGDSGKDNVEIRVYGERKKFNFDPSTHEVIGKKLGLLDFSIAAKITGARFPFFYGDFARLHRSLIEFMIDVHTQEHGYNEVYVPYLANRDSFIGTGQFPKFEEEQFGLSDGYEFYLIPTGEVPVTNIVRGEIIDCNKLPLKFVAHTPCFRRESGSYGQDTKGLIRNHQFEKVELVKIVKPEDSYSELETLTNDAENILKKLNLPYRVVSLCGKDLGFSAAKTYDIEVWFPGSESYREISSCSNFEDFQARRMKSRFKRDLSSKAKAELVHTLNGSGLPIGRTMAALIENYQEKDGSIAVPDVLQKYMKKKIIKKID